MVTTFNTLSDLHAHGFDSLIDVRSPAEYAIDHLPGAVNLPVLDDAERVEVGTIYKQISPFSARKTGAALVARNAALHLQGPLADKDGSWRPLVYCWRGGQRSGSFANILAQVGWRTEVIKGGYQSYRRLVSKAMHDTPLSHRLIILDGNTGTAKTELLHLLAAQGEHVVDLENLAAHRGSVFGAVASNQPSQKSFEGNLATAFAGFDPKIIVWLEAESSKIGKLLIPPTVWQAMKTAPRISVSAPLVARAEYLVRAYDDILADQDLLIAKLQKLTPYQGRERVANWKSLVTEGKMKELAGQLMQFHYDPSYLRSRTRHAANTMAQVKLESFDNGGLDQAVRDILKVSGQIAAN